ncbi:MULTISPECIES: MerR family transcriptional regulator [Streptomyces]|uniref:MerR-family transcriptional regulatory protein n=1 Tax=Streptomyces coelicolor (strain ATCC BAA-471 / A3(2) / M145) TaxID=100226 RepID=Q9F2R2_STRCO|nr:MULTISPECIES: MerR family transcriptional regulator [Streptomyces]MYU43996.1 MerR family transcriptional regulator [Streptomyces sp. SID7813]WTE19313.1 MerR family transcriptional regulator [Streptomyces anthocyanicus]MDX2925589.1 MerR family transcriptional regulator [Streptomyces sp. NRRL_B-16638]MDX3370377.1 MerR family transcriptional regulator [Streptomyces sp. ME02-6987-2C]MDX3411383.1 MerR family transcriptional regulator [Streptomyces sp. ME02-6977A]
MSNRERRLRTVDLARAVGLSTQQVRNYEDAGVLPPAGRTDAGYRVFGERHRDALLTYRALQPGYGAVTATRVMRAVHAGDVAGALALVDAAHAALHEERVALRAAGEALEALSGRDAAPPPRSGDGPHGLRIGEVAALVGVRTSALRVWEAAGLLVPGREHGTGYRVYGPADVRDARVVRTLRRSHHLFEQIRPVLEDLRRAGSGAALRAAVEARGRALTVRTRSMLAGAAALHAYLE